MDRFRPTVLCKGPFLGSGEVTLRGRKLEDDVKQTWRESSEQGNEMVFISGPNNVQVRKGSGRRKTLG